jgi:nitronate monooxygenase
MYVPGNQANLKDGKRAKDAGADVIVAQGSDSGGHGTSNSASIITLVPELVSTLPQTPILAAGGIVDASGTLAALSLGAEGVIIGTRFATSVESSMAENAKLLILKTVDGGATTQRYSYRSQSWFILGLGYTTRCAGKAIGW